MCEHRLIVRMKFGSHLYGTATPTSDLDFKSVFMPSARSILLQSAPKTIHDRRPKGLGEKNYAGEIDEERISIQKFLGLAAEGQAMALDMLFAPAAAFETMPLREWLEIVANRARLLSRNSAAFVGYLRQQANKYGIKGSRVAASRSALAIIEEALATHGPKARLEVLATSIDVLVKDSEHMAVFAENGGSARFWQVCDRKMSFTVSIKTARDIMQRVVDEYGRRALMAENQQRVDWKALSHAVRVGEQALELLHTGHITFPLTKAAHIVDIKLGRLLYQDVAAEIEDLLERVEAAGQASALPDEPDYGWISDFVESVHRHEVQQRP